MLEETNACTNVPCSVHVATAEVGARAYIFPFHVLQGKSKLWTSGNVYAGQLAKSDGVAQIDGDFEGAILLSFRDIVVLFLSGTSTCVICGIVVLGDVEASFGVFYGSVETDAET